VLVSRDETGDSTERTGTTDDTEHAEATGNTEHAETTAESELSWTEAGTELEYDCPGFGVRRDEVQLPDGTPTDYHYVDDPPAVVVLPFTPAGEVVVIEEWRQAVDRVNRGLPAGTMERADGGERAPWFDQSSTFESVERAARRELTEETGYAAGEIEQLTTVEPSNGISNSVHHHVVARGCTPAGGQNLDDNESIRVETTDFESLYTAVVDGEIRDGRTVIAVYQFAASEVAVPGERSGCSGE
jgi:ADP-ribose pyrophosphatase